ncbi:MULTISPECIES: NAD(P)/FAD-dependent oxidoreductase [unclassified Nocardia]|uniref:protoporphyrinogen/coproporphyrinogen oxidase n=1 Tax=unclassified Nocardia TaxID=2637762 RepID=UPI001CE44962|nr:MULTISPECIES: NAD(P)/FAD-dependent oxidoreductase [unclassified Nocardia]
MGEQPVIVVGAGIAGLSAAFRLKQKGHAVTVLEQCGPELVGGRMATIRCDGFHVDLGATMLFGSYREIIGLIRDAGLWGKVCPASDLYGIVRDGVLYRMQRSASRLRLLRSPFIRTLPVLDLVKIGVDLARVRSALGWADMSRVAPRDFESVTQYAARRRLRQDTLEYFLSPLVEAATLGEAELQSMVSALFFINMLITGDSGAFTSSTGVGFLPRGLAEQVTVHYNATVTSVEERGNEVVVSWSGPNQAERIDRAAACVIAVPPPQLLQIYQQLDGEQREFLQRFRYSRSVHVAFGLDRSTTEHAPLIMVPQVEDPDLLAYVLEHALTPDRVPAGTGLVMAHLRGSSSERCWDLDDDKVLDTVLAANHRLGLVPELDQHVCMTRVLRRSPCLVIRQPGEFRAMARYAASLRPDSRVQFAGEDRAQSTTNASAASGAAIARTIGAVIDGSLR